MISAFGVEHSISKSLVGGKWKRAAQLTSSGRQMMGGYKKATGVTEADAAYRGTENEIRAMHEAADRGYAIGVHPGKVKQTKGGTLRRYNDSSFIGPLPTQVAGLHMRVGGKRTGTSFVHIKDTARKTDIKHEMSHAAPVRSGYRVHQITENPLKSMREEARADFLASGHYAAGKPMSGYAEAARARAAGTAAHKQESGKPVVRNVARLLNRRTNEFARLTEKNVQQNIGKPGVDRVGIDEYRRVQDRMYRAKYGKEPPKVNAPGRFAGPIVGGTAVTGAGAAGTAGVVHHRRKK